MQACHFVYFLKRKELLDVEDSEDLLCRHDLPVTQSKNASTAQVKTTRPSEILVICIYPDISRTQSLCFLLGCTQIRSLRDIYAITSVFKHMHTE